MLRFVPLLAVFCLLLGVACSDDGDDGTAGPTTFSPSPQNGSNGPPVTPPPKPEEVPEAARAVTETVSLGSIERRANQPPQANDTRELTGASCDAALMTIETAEETIYAGLPCDRFWNEPAQDAFRGQEVALVLEVGNERFRVLVETLTGAQAEFTVEGIWVQSQ